MHPFVVPCLSSQSLTKGPEFPRSRFARVSLLLALLLYACALPTLGQKSANVRLHGDLTTAPVTAETSAGTLMIVGTKDGLLIFDTTGFKPIGRVSSDGGHHPAGSLAIVDLDGDKSSDQVVVITNLGRIVAVGLSDARIIWVADGFSPAGTMAFWES